MIAPFWADVDTRASGSGQVFMRNTGTNKFAVAWDHVGYYDEQTDKLNTFQVLISDGNDSSMGIGNNVCFCYGDMQWTTGSASSGSGGFGGTYATVGINKGDGVSFSQIGRYGQPGNGLYGIDSLDGQTYCFAATGVNIPPVPSGFPPSNLTALACGANITNMVVSFAAPEGDQTTTLTVAGAVPPGLIVTISDHVLTATATINWTPTSAADVTLTFTATDSLLATTVRTLRITSPGPCSIPCTVTCNPLSAQTVNYCKVTNTNAPPLSKTQVFTITGCPTLKYGTLSLSRTDNPSPLDVCQSPGPFDVTRTYTLTDKNNTVVKRCLQTITVYPSVPFSAICNLPQNVTKNGCGYTSLPSSILNYKNVFNISHCPDCDYLMTVKDNVDTSTSACTGGLHVTRTYSLTESNNVPPGGPVLATCVQNFLIKTPQSAECEIEPKTKHVECGNDIPNVLVQPNISGVTTCNCSFGLTSVVNSTSGTVCTGINTTRTYSLVQNGDPNNTKTCYEYIIYRDTKPPVFATPKRDNCNLTSSTLFCGDQPPVETCNFTDKCPLSTVTTTYCDNITADGSQLVRTWTATDQCNQASLPQSRNFTYQTKNLGLVVRDHVCKVADLVDTDWLNLAGWPTPPPCPITITPGTATGVDANLCVARGINVNRPYTLTDADGDTLTCYATLNIPQDTIPPVHDAICPSSAVTGTCGATIPFPPDTCTFSDRCPVTTTECTQIDGGQLVHKWTSLDLCNNSNSFEQIIRFTHVQTLPPSEGCGVSALDGHWLQNWTYNCDASPCTPLTFQDSTNTHPNPSTDSSTICDNPYGKEWTKTFEVTDGTTHLDVCTQTLYVKDTTAPTLSGCPTDTSYNVCPGVAIASASSTSCTPYDACDPSPTVTMCCAQDGFGFTRTWAATDSCGNHAGGNDQVQHIGFNVSPTCLPPA